MDFINDNAGCFANGGKFPQNGRTIEFGSIRVYFGTVPELWRKEMNVRHRPARQNRRWSVTQASREHLQRHRQPLFKRQCTRATPIAQNIDPAKAQEELEATRKALLTGGADIIRAQRELNLTLREYNAAHGFAC
ncbi:hypothetical protein QYE76_046180 [Lolium multiflorum]|uniref:Uncharacterized protein n=1 Tax=Lolium multiflorum TaxID=4521 RepID=A0AAD8TP92_LOLMU|nr:hypothetical protein QYE76_046180 [Lolium multiflorum]